MNKKLIFGLILLGISVLNPGCKHEQVNGKSLYIKYLKSHIRK
ncbi:hypothetical protein ATK78_4078 [Pedobacter metabolipauper]|uniref:Uncharacterized protein n=1 Tax=Pedobacter metabolipauper TaxID=425513 RepID=A0A4R6SRK0_9SPHI|nr:hypothetical protein ATK78_4078 [Pedobacter metabolipauper]